MQLTPLAELHDTVNAASFSTPSYTPRQGRLLVAVVATSAAAAGNPDSISGNGLTWVQKAARNNGAGTARLMLYVAKGALNPAAGALTLTYAINQAGQHLSVFEIEGILVPGQGVLDVVVQTVSGSGTDTSGSLTLAGPRDPRNRPIAVFSHAANELHTPRANWTEIHDGAFDTPALGLLTEWRADAFEAVASASWVTNAEWVGIAAEIAAARDSAFSLRRLGGLRV